MVPTTMARRLVGRLRPALFLAALGWNIACGGGTTGPQPPSPPPPPPPPPGVISILPSVSSSIIERGGQAAITVVVTRAGNFTGPITLTVEGLPSGVTVAQSNVATAGAATTATVTFTVAGSAALGRTDLTLRAAGSGVTDATTIFQLTVTAPVVPAYELTVTGSPITVAQGATGQGTVTIARSGGFAGSVTLTFEGAPAGLTVAFDPAATTGGTATLNVLVGAAVTPNTYTLTLRGVATGLTDRIITFQVTVTAVTSTGAVVLDFSQCGSPYAIWVAYRDGPAAAWTPVTGLNARFQCTVNAPIAAFAYVVRQGGSSATTINVEQMTRAEMSATPIVYCPPLTTGTKFINGAVVGLAGNQSAFITMGGGFLATPTQLFPTFTLGLVPDGDRDLVAYRWNGIPGATDRIILRRDLNLPNGGNAGNLDFAAAEAVLAAPATLTIGNLLGDGVLETMTFLSRTSCDAGWLYQIGGSPATHTIYGVPTASLRASDFHSVRIAASTSTSSRYIEESFRAMANRTVILGGRVDPATVSILPGTYKRLEGTFPFPLGYNVEAKMSYIQTSGVPRTVNLIATTASLASTTATLTMPDFTGVTGWSDSWAPGLGLATRWTITATGRDAPGNRCRDGARQIGASVQGTN